ncbi:MAG: RNA methyltransferase [Prevotellaceae bacterium]|jgi:tRNA G18 (ribose-2'-O)-methylase SpoU|nr:RNA methyltransferase [Prevotellaceae bacterium]
MRKLKTEEIKRISPQEFVRAKKTPLVVVLDNVRSLHNIGSVFRTSDAYRVEEVILCGITAAPPHPDIHKSALGAEFTVTWHYVARTEQAVDALKERGYTVLAAEQTDGSTLITDFRATPDCKYAIVVGNEVKGVQQSVIDRCDGCLELPQFGVKHSLNVSVATGILIWELFKAVNSE